MKNRERLTPLHYQRLDHARFLIGSQSRPGTWHLVDLEENRWHGRCDCERFRYKYQPDINRGLPATDKMMCEHLRRARYLFYQEIAPKSAAVLRAAALLPQ